jgi:hypothetical protein
VNGKAQESFAGKVGRKGEYQLKINVMGYSASQITDITIT